MPRSVSHFTYIFSSINHRNYLAQGSSATQTIVSRVDGDCEVNNYTPAIDCEEYCDCYCNDDMAEEAAINYVDLITNYSGGGSSGKAGKSGSSGINGRVDIDTVSGKGKAGKSGSSRRERELSGKGKGGKGYSDNQVANAALLAIMGRATDVAGKCKCDCEVINWAPESGDTEEVIVVVTPKPTPKPTFPPTKSPTERPTFNPTKSPTTKPTARPSPAPTPVRSSSLLLFVRFDYRKISLLTQILKILTHRSSSPLLYSFSFQSPTPRPTNAPTPQPTDKPTNNPTPAPTKNPTSAPSEAPVEDLTNRFGEETCVKSHPSFPSGTYDSLAGWSVMIAKDTTISCDETGIWDLGWPDDGPFDALVLFRNGVEIMRWGAECPDEYPVQKGDHLVFFVDNSHEYRGFRICTEALDGLLPTPPPDGVMQGDCSCNARRIHTGGLADKTKTSPSDACVVAL